MDSLFTPENQCLVREVMMSKHIKTSTRIFAAGFYAITRFCNFIDWLFPVPV